LKARNIKNIAIINRDPQSLRFEEMQSEIKVKGKQMLKLGADVKLNILS
jgi:hypothetical protein